MTTEIDFDDEDAVLAEMARELDINPGDLTIRESRGLSGFGAGTVYEVSIRGGHKEWCVVRDEDQEQELAIEIVKQDLDESPENFTQSWIEGHINTDRLRSDLESDVINMCEENLRDMSDDDFWREASREGLDEKWVVEWETPDNSGTLGPFTSENDAIDAGEDWKREQVEALDDEDEDIGEADFYYSTVAAEPDESDISDLAERQAQDQLKDPMEYLEGIYGREDAIKQAIKIAGIDIDAAAEEAVSTDGAAHFLSSYDGKTTLTKSGLVYWRTN